MKKASRTRSLPLKDWSFSHGEKHPLLFLVFGCGGSGILEYLKSGAHIIGENTNFFHFRFRAIFHPKSIGVNIGTFLPIETGSLTRSEKLFSRLSIIPYPLKIVLSLKYGRKKTFTSFEKTSQPQPLRKDPRGGTRMTMWKTFVSFDVFRRICKETLKFKSLTHING